MNYKVRKSLQIGREDYWVVDTEYNDDASYINAQGKTGQYVDFETEAEAEKALGICLGIQKNPEIRTFETGATRDTVEGKLDYMKALSPIVLRRYVQYLDKHRLQPDGSMRDFDNWKKGIPLGTYHSSKGRHFFAAWLIEEGYKVSDNHGPIDEEDALCGELFNTMGRLHELLKSKINRDESVDGGY